MRSIRDKFHSAFALCAGLSKPVDALFVVAVVNGAGIFIFPFLTLFLTKKLGMDALWAAMFGVAVAAGLGFMSLGRRERPAAISATAIGATAAPSPIAPLPAADDE